MNNTNETEIAAILKEIGHDSAQTQSGTVDTTGRDNGMTEELRDAIGNIARFKDYLAKSDY